MLRKTAMFLIGIMAWGILCVYAQVTTATISGTVTDSTGKVVPGVKMVIQNSETGIARSVQTDDAGRYSAPSLALGPYQISGSMEGFQTETRTGIVLTVGRDAVVDMQLSVGAVAQQITVAGEAPLVETSEATVGYLVSDTTVRDLPINGRDLAQLILLQPGVTNAVDSIHSDTSVGFGKRISIAGMRGEDNGYYLDGSYIGDYKHHTPAGPSGNLIGIESVREFQVLTSSLSAQYGRVMGGVFNAVSQSGTNQWHGDLYEFLRNSDLDAAQWQDNAFSKGIKQPFRRNQFGGTIGGPIQKDKAFIFLAFEALRQSLTSTTTNTVMDNNARLGILPIPGTNNTMTVPVSQQIAPYLKYFPLANGPELLTAGFPSGTAQYTFAAVKPANDNFGQARFDYQLSDKDSIFARFTGSNGSEIFPLNYNEFTQSSRVGTALLTLSETHIVSPQALNTVHFNFDRVVPTDIGTYPPPDPTVASVPGQSPPGLIPGSGITSFEGLTKFELYITNRFNFQDDYNLTIGAHSLQLGGAFERMQFNMNQAAEPWGEWTFGGLSQFLAATPTSYRGTPPSIGNSERGYRQDFFGLYVQDKWQVMPRLTLTLGLRWEPYTAPIEVNGLMTNLIHLLDASPTVGPSFFFSSTLPDIEPRFGLAWSPTPSGKTSVRAGFSMLYSPIDPIAYYLPATRQAPFFPTFIIPDDGYFPNAIAEITNSPFAKFGSIDAFQPTSKTPHALQFNFTLERQLGADTVLSVGYIGSRGKDQLSLDEYNEGPAYFDGLSMALPVGSVPENTNYSQVVYNSDNASSWYNALAIHFEKRLSRGLQAGASYTWSKLIDQADAGSMTNGVNVGGSGFWKLPYDPPGNNGLAGYNFTNSMTTNFSYTLPFGNGLTGLKSHLLSGWEWNGILTAQSGQPFWLTVPDSTQMTALGVQTRSPNLNPNFAGPIVLGGPNQYFNTAAYLFPSAMEYGNVGRNTLVGPGLVTLDTGFFKTTHLTERSTLEFRAEAFNIANRANFNAPATSLFSATGVPVATAGKITTTVTNSRQIQFGLKLLF